MNKELSVGMYVRNDYFGIGKIDKDYFDSNNKHWFNVQFNCYGDDDCHCGICEETMGFKASNNIIDLIEVGDYVKYKQSNMYWNIPTRVSGRYNRQQQLTELMVDDTPLKNVEITSIVTKEQFKSMEYVVDNNN